MNWTVILSIYDPYYDLWCSRCRSRCGEIYMVYSDYDYEPFDYLFKWHAANVCHNCIRRYKRININTDYTIIYRDGFKKITIFGETIARNYMQHNLASPKEIKSINSQLPNRKL